MSTGCQFNRLVIVRVCPTTGLGSLSVWAWAAWVVWPFTGSLSLGQVIGPVHWVWLFNNQLGLAIGSNGCLFTGPVWSLGHHWVRPGYWAGFVRPPITVRQSGSLSPIINCHCPATVWLGPAWARQWAWVRGLGRQQWVIAWPGSGPGWVFNGSVHHCHWVTIGSIIAWVQPSGLNYRLLSGVWVWVSLGHWLNNNQLGLATPPIIPIIVHCLGWALPVWVSLGPSVWAWVLNTGSIIMSVSIIVKIVGLLGSIPTGSHHNNWVNCCPSTPIKSVTVNNTNNNNQ